MVDHEVAEDERMGDGLLEHGFMDLEVLPESLDVDLVLSVELPGLLIGLHGELDEGGEVTELGGNPEREVVEVNECSWLAVSPAVDHARDDGQAFLGRDVDEERLGEEPALPDECLVTDSSQVTGMRLLHQVATELLEIRLGGDDGIDSWILDLVNDVGNRCLGLDLL